MVRTCSDDRGSDRSVLSVESDTVTPSIVTNPMSSAEFWWPSVDL